MEVIVYRMRYIASLSEDKIRIMAPSTSLENAKDLGEWIGATPHRLFNFPPRVRPDPLQIHNLRVDITNFEARMQAMRRPTYTAIVQHARNGKPILRMMVHATRPLLDNSGKCMILCHASWKECYKKFLYEVLPGESQFA